MSCRGLGQKLATVCLLGVLFSASLAGAAGLSERMPQGASLTGHLDLAALRESSVLSSRLGSRGLGIQGDWAQLAAWAEDELSSIGISLSKDIDRLAFGSFPLGEAAGADLVLLFSGRFDPARLLKALEERGGNKFKVGALSGWQGKPSAGRGGVLSLLDTQTVFLGSRLGLGRLARAAALPSAGATPKGLPENVAAWVKAQDLSTVLSGLKGNPILGGVAESVTGLSAWLGATDRVTLGAVVRTRSAEEASRLSMQAQMGLGLFGLQAGAEVSSILKTLRLGAVGPLVKAQVTLTEAELGSLLSAP